MVVTRFDADPPRYSLLADGVESALIYGDTSGEHHIMKRGPHSAWPYVYAAFLAEIAMFGALPGMAALFLARIAGMSGNPVLFALVAFTLLTGTFPAWVVFRDRWYCIEARTSRYCTDLPGISWLYAPVIAFLYANFRGLKKLLDG